MKQYSIFIVTLFILGFCAGVDAMTAKQVIEQIKANVNCEWAEKTVDTFKAGDPNNQIKGIATTFTASQEVLEKAVAAGCNLIITHEPTFYHGQDDATQLGDDAVIKTKKAYIKKHELVIWRFHDHIHRHNPDGIYEGMIDKLGWREYLKPNEKKVFEVPEISLRRLAEEMKERFNSDTIRVIGGPSLETTKVGFSAGAPWSVDQMKLLQRDDVEILIAGETREWETVEYVRDAVAQGKRKAIILLGHCLSEEAGMDYCAEWLGEFITDIPIHFIPAGNPYWAP